MADSKSDVGRIFSVPLYEGGYAFGYVTVREKGKETVCNIVDIVSDSATIPDDLHTMPLAIEKMLIGGAEFAKGKGIEELQWKLSSRYMPGDVVPAHAYFIMLSQPAYKLVDFTRNTPTRIATAEEIARYPKRAVDFPPFTTKIVEKAVRHWNIDPALIGAERPAGTKPN